MKWTPPKARAVPRIFDKLVRLRPVHAGLLILFFLMRRPLPIDATAIADLFAASTIWFGPVYLLVACAATWSLGWKAGQLTGIACMGLAFAINGLSLYPYGGRRAPRLCQGVVAGKN